MYVNKSTQGGKKFPGNSSHSSHRQALPALDKYYTCCGKPLHPRQIFTDSNATCFHRNRKGYFSSQCLSKTMGELTTPSYLQSDSKVIDNDPYSDMVYVSADTIYLDTVSNTSTTQWNVMVLVGGNPVLFKVDIRAEVTALSEKTYRTFISTLAQLQESPHAL